MNLQGKVSGNVLTFWLHAYQIGMRAIGESPPEPTTATARGINALGNLSTWSEKMAVQIQRMLPLRGGESEVVYFTLFSDRFFQKHPTRLRSRTKSFGLSSLTSQDHFPTTSSPIRCLQTNVDGCANLSKVPRRKRTGAHAE